MATLDFDVAVIGGGSAGYAAARTTQAGGLRTALIEGGSEIGGLCILRGCMPTKALLYAAEVRHLARHASIWGIQSGPVPFDWSAVMARKEAQIRDFADYRRKQLEDGRLIFIRAGAEFEDPYTVRLTDGRKLSARNFIIATGSIVSPSPWPPLTKAGYLTSDGALSLKKLPRSLIVLGGGAVAIELAQFFRRFDVEVTVIQRSSHILRDFDADAAAVVETVLRREGVQLYTGTHVVDVRRENERKIIVFEQAGKTVEVAGEEILFGLGRIPNTSSLALDRAGVALAGPRIITDEQMRTSTPNIFAAGDCTGPHEIVHVAIQQGEVAARNILSPANPRMIDYRLLITVVFTDPAVAQVGLSEMVATSQGIPFLAASYPFNDHGKSLIMEAKDGFVKLLADPATGRILGGTCVGPFGGDLIHEIVAAMAGGMTVHQLAAMPHYHPTLAEIWTYPAEELADKIPPPTANPTR